MVDGNGVLVAREGRLLVELQPVLAHVDHVLHQRAVRLLAGLAVDGTGLPDDEEADQLLREAGGAAAGVLGVATVGVALRGLIVVADDEGVGQTM